jgi:hypothetical protein
MKGAIVSTPPTYDNGAPLVSVTLDKVRHLRMDLGALRAAEERLSVLKGRDVYILDVLQSKRADGTTGQWSITEMVVLLWAMLCWEDETLTEADVGRLIHMGNLPIVTQAIAKSMEITSPEVTAASSSNGAVPSDPPIIASIGPSSGL